MHRVRNNNMALAIVIGVITAPLIPAEASDAIFLGQDNTRCSFDGKQQIKNLTLEAVYEDPIDNSGVMILTSPAVSHGRIFGASCVSDPPDTYGSVFCLDAITLEPKWRVEEIELPQTGKLIELKGCISSPAVSADGNYVVIGQGLHNDKNSHLLCFNTSDGTLQWAIESELHIESSPVIYGDRVVVGCGAIENGKSKKPKGHPGYVMAVRISDGSILWKYDINDPERSPALSNGMVFVGSGVNGNRLVALRTAADSKNEQRLVWSTITPLPITSPITLANGLVIAGGGDGTISRSAHQSSGMVVALEQRTGKIRWSHKLRDSVFGAVAVRDDIGIVTCKSGEIIALNIESGKILWKRTPKPGHAIVTGSVFTGKYIYTVTSTGYLIVLDAANGGKLIQSIYLNHLSRDQIDFSLSTPTLVDGRLYVGSETGGLRCYTGTEVK